MGSLFQGSSSGPRPSTIGAEAFTLDSAMSMSIWICFSCEILLIPGVHRTRAPSWARFSNVLCACGEREEKVCLWSRGGEGG